MPTTDIIQPLHRLPFTDLSPEGVQGVAMHPVAPTVYVHVHQQFVDPLAAALAYWPWVLTPIAPLLLAFILWRTLRILSRPQRRGVPHCRKCNYDLSGATATTPTAPLSLGALTKGEGRGEGSPSSASTPPSTSAPSSSCPECGRALTRRNILEGRSTGRRVAPLAIPFAALLAIGTLAVALSTGWRPTLPPWPSSTAQLAADRLGLSIPKPFLVDCSTIVEVDLATGTRLRTVISAVPAFWCDFGVDPTGQMMIIGGRETSSVAMVSTRSGRVVARIIPRPGANPSLQIGYIEEPICGFAPDGSAAYVMVHADTDSFTRVVRWSFNDHSMTPIADIPTARESPHFLWVRQAMVLPGGGERVVSWSHSSEVYPSGDFIVTLHAGPGPAVKAVNFGTDMWPHTVPSASPDGARAYFLGRTGSLIAIQTDDMTSLGAVPAGVRSPLVKNIEADPTGRFVSLGGPLLRDTHAREWITPFGLPPEFRVKMIRFSTTPRFVAATAAAVSYTGPGANEMLIWDLTPLRTKLPPAPGN